MAFVTMGNKSKKELNFELNLIPFIDLLSTLICFLLVTVAWVHLGSMDTSQAFGPQDEKQTKPPAVWATLKSTGQIIFKLQNVSKRGNIPVEFEVQASNQKGIQNYLTALTKQIPEIKTAVVLPSQSTPYADIIQIMDNLKKGSIKDIGISPI
ncbi:MAG: biopolymer transporter ExbD [Oligoflexia bacterium]|nr:biopolymer transporter ExbD [Oligoflexia bacterium]